MLFIEGIKKESLPVLPAQRMLLSLCRSEDNTMNEQKDINKVVIRTAGDKRPKED